MRFSLPSVVVLGVMVLGCGGSGDGGPGGRPCTATSDCADGLVCRDMRCVAAPDTGAPDGGADGGMDARPMDTGVPPCTSDGECGDGVCLAGACCESADRVCGDACCGAGESCFANACVVPGRECRSADDCDDGEYCEPSFGEEPTDGADAGVPDGGTDAGMEGCFGAAPRPGRCLALPPRCAGEEPAPGEVCITACEYRPPVEDLDAVVQWTWGPDVAINPGRIDVWSTPVVGRVTDTNCDGVVDEFDPPNIAFVSGDAAGTCCGCGGADTACKTGVLRMVDGITGRDVWGLRRPETSSAGFSGVSVAIGDLDHDGDMEVVALSGEGYVFVVDHTGVVVAKSDLPVPGFGASNSAGWGGGVSIADMDHDGNPEIAYGRAVFTTDGATVTRLWVGTGAWGRALTQAISVFVDLDDEPELELLAGNTVYEADGTIKWTGTQPEGFSAVANFDDDPEPEVVHVADGVVYLLNAVTGAAEAPALAAPSGPTDPGNGGPPTIADFDGDGKPEIGVAWRNNYQVLQLNDAGDALESVWATPNHDFSSSVTGSTVFDFEGDGAAEVIYNDECFLWVYDGTTGRVRFATPTTSFTATEASLVADVDGDGSAEIVMVSNGASPTTWHCNGPFNGVDWTMPAPAGAADEGRPGWVGANGLGSAGTAYRGLTVFRARDNSWVGTRSLWNQHAYSVSNVCGDRGDACSPPSTYGDIPRNQVANWSVGFLNNFRQNIQGEGIFDAPDATVSLRVLCETPPRLVASVRNLGAAVLTEGVTVGFYSREGGTDTLLGTGVTTTRLFPGQVAEVSLTTPAGSDPMGLYVARILVDPDMPTFRECREDNNDSEEATGRCLL